MTHSLNTVPPASVESAFTAAMRGFGATIGEPIPCRAPLSVIAECMWAGIPCATCELNPANFSKAGTPADRTL